MSLFQKAKKTAAKTATAKKDDKVRINVEDPTFFDKIAKVQDLQDVIKSAEAKVAMLTAIVTGKQIGRAHV